MLCLYFKIKNGFIQWKLFWSFYGLWLSVKGYPILLNVCLGIPLREHVVPTWGAAELFLDFCYYTVSIEKNILALLFFHTCVNILWVKFLKCRYCVQQYTRLNIWKRKSNCPPKTFEHLCSHQWWVSFPYSLPNVEYFHSLICVSLVGKKIVY